MSKGPKNVTSTTNTEPPSFLVGPLTTAVNAAQSQFTGQTGFRPAPAQTPPISGGGAMGDLIRRVLQARDGGGSIPISGGAAGGQAGSFGGGLIGQGQDLLGRTLAGDFLTPESNPFLQQTFNRAADLTRTRLSSEFAGAGRDLSAAMPARSEELQTLASNIFGQNFQAERDRQLDALGQSQQFDPLNLFINRLAGIIPGAGGTTTSTQPVFRTGLFSDRRLKRNIKRIGEKNGYAWYSFDYIWGEKGEGVMSDEVPSRFVSKVHGFDVVDYIALGV